MFTRDDFHELIRHYVLVEFTCVACQLTWLQPLGRPVVRLVRVMCPDCGREVRING
jgi:hypothetical protein